MKLLAPFAWALIPFDDSPVPPRALEKLVRKRCKAYAKDIRSIQHDQFLSLAHAIGAANDYVSFARQTDSQYFIELWGKLIDQANAAQPQ